MTNMQFAYAGGSQTRYLFTYISQSVQTCFEDHSEHKQMQTCFRFMRQIPWFSLPIIRQLQECCLVPKYRSLSSCRGQNDLAHHCSGQTSIGCSLLESASTVRILCFYWKLMGWEEAGHINTSVSVFERLTGCYSCSKEQHASLSL